MLPLECQGCHSPIIQFNSVNLQPLFSRYLTKKDLINNWHQCQNCLSVFRSCSKTSDYKYSDSEIYIQKEFSKRLSNISRITESIDINSIIFDLGSGPGIISKILSDMGYQVIQVEPSRDSFFKSIPQLKIDIQTFINQEIWKQYLKPMQKASILLIDVLEHLPFSIDIFKLNSDSNLSTVYIETGCVDYAFPSLNRWYYLDYSDHIFVPSINSIYSSFNNNNISIERISNSLNNYSKLNNYFRKIIYYINKLSYLIFNRDIFLVPIRSMHDHISITIKP
ncbi:hypothetical protein [Polynucleobacter campilacus]|uniref:Uncharacterized protein n=1 Tax=Polynucleobacter campilacus TaxID=1743163 RepID=A0A254Q1J6_9BURK|nr:hypothetical protein [Polynucleobacter campilacus]OWS70691.1 hypothetical protein CBI31_00090 [Polynucleobacter campilacus]